MQAWIGLFQSSPDPKVGCYTTMHTLRSHRPCFNPHPTRRSGATLQTRDWTHVDDVSILTRPEGRVLRTAAGCASRPLTVSILTRPEGRVLRSSG